MACGPSHHSAVSLSPSSLTYFEIGAERDGIASSVAVGDHGGCERTLRCCLSNLRKPGITQDHLRLAAMVLSAPVQRHACLIKVGDVYQLLLGNADLVCDWIMICKPKLHQVALPIVKPQLYVLVCCPPNATVLPLFNLCCFEVHSAKHTLKKNPCFAFCWDVGMEDLMHMQHKLLVTSILCHPIDLVDHNKTS